MDDVAHVECPYCGEAVEVYFEADVTGSLVQDCEVCCRPWKVTVLRDRHGDLDVRAEADSD